MSTTTIHLPEVVKLVSPRQRKRPAPPCVLKAIVDKAELADFAYLDIDAGRARNVVNAFASDALCRVRLQGIRQVYTDGSKAGIGDAYMHCSSNGGWSGLGAGQLLVLRERRVLGSEFDRDAHVGGDRFNTMH